MFMKNINRVLTRDVLLDQVWGYDAMVETNIVDVYVRYLRNKLHSVDKEEYIQTRCWIYNEMIKNIVHQIRNLPIKWKLTLLLH